MDDEKTSTAISTGYDEETASPSYPTLPHISEENQTHPVGHHEQTTLSSYPTTVAHQAHQIHPADPGPLTSYSPQPQVSQGYQATPCMLTYPPTASNLPYPSQPQVPQMYPITTASNLPYPSQPQVPQMYPIASNLSYPSQPQVPRMCPTASNLPYPSQPQVPPMCPTASNLPYPTAGNLWYPQPGWMATQIFLSNRPSSSPQWSTGLFDCFDDIPFCCLTAWCPCITFGRTAEIIDRGASSCGMTGGLYTLILVFTGLQSIYSCMYRAKFKQQTGMPQDTFQDCCIHFWCHGCALCQEYRELQRQGLQPSIGWYGNLETMRMGTGLTTPPIVPGGMTR